MTTNKNTWFIGPIWPIVVGGVRFAPFVIAGAANAGSIAGVLGQGSVIHVKSASSGDIHEDTQMSVATLPDHVTEAGHIPPAQLFLRFADKFFGTWTFQELGLNMANMKPETVRPSASGTAVEITSLDGEDVQLDSSSLRYSVDPKYAAQMDAEVESLLIPSDKLERIARNHQPPQEWFDSPEEQV